MNVQCLGHYRSDSACSVTSSDLGWVPSAAGVFGHQSCGSEGDEPVLMRSLCVPLRVLASACVHRQQHCVLIDII